MITTHQATVLVRPRINIEEAKKVVYDLFGLTVITITELNGYDDKNFHIRVIDVGHSNQYINKVSANGYVLKIVNTLESQNKNSFEAQTKLLKTLRKHHIICPNTILTKQQKSFDTISLPTGNHVIRLFEFIPGDILFKIKSPSEEIFRQVGILAAKIDSALQDFHHAAYRKDLQWCLGAAPDILNYVHAVDERKQKLVKKTISEFSYRVLTIEDRLSKGIIHGDINEQNLITEVIGNKTTIKAVIDFGDTHYCCYLYELALAITYMIFLSEDIDSGGHVFAGYSSVREVTAEEFSLLKICVMTRFCQSLVLGAYAKLQDPGNEYVLTTAKKGWGLLERLSNDSDEAVLSRWKAIGETQIHAT